MAATQRARREKSRRRPPLCRQRIVEAALALADDRGDFSMRALGQRLRVDPMAVYRHFRDKDELLDAMVDAALSGFEPPTADAGTPAERLRQMCIDFREALTAHPGVAIRVSTTRPTLGPHTLLLTEGCVAILRELGLDAADATRAFMLIVRFVAGTTVAEERVRAEGSSEEQWREGLRAGYATVTPGDLPNVAAMATEVERLGFDREFEFGVDLIIEGLVRRGATSSRSGSPSDR